MREPLTQDEVQQCQQTVTLMAALIMHQDAAMLQRYVDQVAMQIDGTLDPILPHFMSISDMRKGQRNVRFISKVLEHLLAIRALVTEQAEAEIAGEALR